MRGCRSATVSFLTSQRHHQPAMFLACADWSTQYQGAKEWSTRQENLKIAPERPPSAGGRPPGTVTQIASSSLSLLSSPYRQLPLSQDKAGHKRERHHGNSAAVVTALPPEKASRSRDTMARAMPLACSPHSSAQAAHTPCAGPRTHLSITVKSVGRPLQPHRTE